MFEVTEAWLLDPVNAPDAPESTAEPAGRLVAAQLVTDGKVC